MAAFFHKPLDTKIVPQDWWNANIAPIHIGDSQLDPTNYCPITLTSIVWKTLEGTVYPAI